MLRRIEVDFNAMTSEPVGLVKLDPAESLAGGGLCDGARVVLWEPGLEVEGRVIYDAASGTWLAEPDRATWRDIVLDPGPVSGDVKPKRV